MGGERGLGREGWGGSGDRVDGLWKINKSYPLVTTKVGRGTGAGRVGRGDGMGRDWDRVDGLRRINKSYPLVATKMGDES